MDISAILSTNYNNKTLKWLMKSAKDGTKILEALQAETSGNLFSK